MAAERSWRARAAVVATRGARWLPALRAVGYAAAIAVVAAMGAVAARDVSLGELDWRLLAPAIACAAVWWLLLGLGWSVLASGGPTRTDVGLWCRTQTLRYLPGGVWAPASRVVATGGHVVDRFTTVGAENVIALGAALSLGAAALAAAGRPWWLPLVLAPALPLGASRVTADRTRVDPRRAWRATGTYLAAFVAYAAGATAVQLAVSGPEPVLAVAGSAAIAWGAGLVVVFAPGGIGVRELVYVGLLTNQVDAADAAAGAITMRLVTIVAELAILVLAGAPRMRRSR